MGSFKLAADVAEGQAKITQVQKLSADVQNAVIALKDAANAYDTFRSTTLGGDPDDITEADTRVDTVISNLNGVLASLTPGGKVWFEQILDGVGYQPKP